MLESKQFQGEGLIIQIMVNKYPNVFKLKVLKLMRFAHHCFPLSYQVYMAHNTETKNLRTNGMITIK